MWSACRAADCSSSPPNGYSSGSTPLKTTSTLSGSSPDPSHRSATNWETMTKRSTWRRNLSIRR